MTGKERREQLLNIGRRLFAERGFEGTSIEEIAAQAGVSKPVVYEHFGGKEGLYAVVVDREGDPHSPWRYGDDWKALSKGLVYAHIGWLFDPNKTSQEKFSPDLLADRRIKAVDGWFPGLVAVSLLLPALIGGLWGMSWQGALTAFFWASLVRVALLHHVTWAINSICHTFGSEEFEVRDKSRNVSWMAIASFGESWHNLHHADPTCARHGALKGQLDPSARVIWALEKLGWAYDVRWPDEARLQAKRPATAKRSLGSMTRRITRPGRARDEAAA